MGYFMFGLVATGAAWSFHLLVSFVLACVYISIGTAVANLVPTFEVAQAILGLLGPLFFLFGGLWSPPSQMVIGAQWFCFIDPITYAFRALIPQQFVCRSEPCPSIGLVVADGRAAVAATADLYTFVSTKYQVYVDQQWQSLGYLALFVLAFQALAFYAVRNVRWITR
jgi:hypothetical protein